MRCGFGIATCITTKTTASHDSSLARRALIRPCASRAGRALRARAPGRQIP
ncbi:hypothetical protein ELH53_22750 [Rhizobium ruizarguesonis]|nr:hypothetical protein ELI39_21695 [Rhizobium ruizarguesonis]TAZ97043.1 hypothetical protein ELH67_21940 [Rhizobium ruizarguesonis]TBA39922.1 hypothetical protein ELH60_22095 [Rhizobium ruizarguesonis]TBA82657.1 hypothetical protein ELH56_21485 [Rhizobium ruizarguesonis]TBA87614.1 hypothetical protein ELH53_22750 [Rhizobium ruizarguesonis]